MNPRIRQLAEQAGFKVNWQHEDVQAIKMARFEKFAELIVQECIEQASIGNGHGNNQWDRALTFAAKNIKQHFGVER